MLLDACMRSLSSVHTARCSPINGRLLVLEAVCTFLPGSLPPTLCILRRTEQSTVPQLRSYTAVGRRDRLLVLTRFPAVDALHLKANLFLKMKPIQRQIRMSGDAATDVRLDGPTT